MTAIGGIEGIGSGIAGGSGPVGGGGGGAASIEAETGSSPIKISAFPSAATNMGPDDFVTGLQGGANVNFNRTQLLSTNNALTDTSNGFSQIITIGNGGAVSGSGGFFAIYGGSGYGTGNGSSVDMYAGDAEGTGAGGSFDTKGGAAQSGNGGHVSMNGGFSQTGYGGKAFVYGGHSLSASSIAGAGYVNISGGNAFGTAGGTGGTVYINGGRAVGGAGGAVYLHGGNTTTGAPGNVALFGGYNFAGTGGGGSIKLVPGFDSGGHAGPIIIQGLPTADPHVVNALWNSSGTMHISAG